MYSRQTNVYYYTTLRCMASTKKQTYYYTKLYCKIFSINKRIIIHVPCYTALFVCQPKRIIILRYTAIFVSIN